MQGFIEDIKVDFVSVRDPFNNPPTIIDKIPLADIRDIAALKLNAIKGRGAKKDFWDLAKLLELYSLENLLDFYSKRYPYDDTFAVMRSIVYFEDADAEPDPLSLEQKSWKEVKEIIETAFKEYYNKK